MLLEKNCGAPFLGLAKDIYYKCTCINFRINNLRIPLGQEPMTRLGLVFKLPLFCYCKVWGGGGRGGVQLAKCSTLI